MERLYKMLSRCLDYLWFWSILFFIIDVCNLDMIFYLIITLFLSFLFIPIEAVLIKCFKTTLGKFVFGLRYNQEFTWKSAFRYSCRRALFLKTPSQLIYKKAKLFPHILAITTALLLSSLSIAPEATLNQASKILPFEFLQELKVKRNGGANCPDGWIKLTATTELPFLAFFPSEPKATEVKKPIPHSSRILVYKEYTEEKYSLGYVDLPENWVKWGSNMVFKGTLKQVASHEKGNITQKQKTLHEQYPAMDYVVEKNGSKTFGRLILVGTTIYNLEAKGEAASQEASELFFNSFHLQV